MPLSCAMAKCLPSRWNFLWVVAAATVLAVVTLDTAQFESEAEKEVEDAARERGYAMGVTGEFFRYKHLYHKAPKEADRDEAMRVASKVRCEVCTAIVGSLVKKAQSLSEDDLADML